MDEEVKQKRPPNRVPLSYKKRLKDLRISHVTIARESWRWHEDRTGKRDGVAIQDPYVSLMINGDRACPKWFRLQLDAMIQQAEGPGAKREGFTLVEVMVATAILLIFGLMVTATLRYGTSLWRSGHRRSGVYDGAAILFTHLEQDFDGAKSQFWNTGGDAFDTRVKFWVDHDALFADDPLTTDDDDDWKTEGGRQRLRFVRGIPDNSLNPRIRQAGDGTADNEYYNLKDDDGDGAVDEDLMAVEGMCEVAYLMGLGPDDRQTLYRALLAPIGRTFRPFTPGDPPPADGRGRIWQDHAGWTFFDPETFESPERVEWKALPLAENVLHFEVRLSSQYTTTWDAAVGFERWAQPHTPEPCGPVFTWDSDRLFSNPAFLMDWGEDDFLDKDSDGDGLNNSMDLDYVADNVFPRSIMVIVVLEAPKELRQQNRLRLREDVDAGVLAIPVVGTQPAHNENWSFIRIGEEWIEFSGFDVQAQEFTVAERGVRGTAALEHYAEDLVTFGYTFSRVFHNPASKEYSEH